MSETTPVRWGVLGVARVFERRMVPAFQTTETNTLIAVASRTREKAESACATHGIERAYGSYAALLADPDVDAVYIPLPNDQHREWSIRALEAGKHVLCDKPTALSYEDARAMAAAAQRAGCRLQEGFMYRHHPQHRRLREIVASREIGDPVEIRGVCSYAADLTNRANIRWNISQGGGALLDVGVYPLNAVRLYFGDEPTAVYSTSVLEPETGVDLHTTALLEFSGGRTAAITGGFDQAFASRLEIAGTRGSVTLSRAFQVGEKGVVVRVSVGDETREEAFPHRDQYACQLEDFAACIRDPQKPFWPAEDGVAQARAVEALRRSATERRRVLLDEITA